MDIGQVILSLNKIAILAFVVTLFVTFYEVMLLVRNRQRNKKIALPEFKGEEFKSIKTISINTKKDEESGVKGSENDVGMKHLLILIILLLIFGGLSLVGLWIAQDTSSQSGSTKEIKSQVLFAESSGIVVFDSQWNMIDGNTVPADELVYIGLRSIPKIDEIDRARIRINSDSWTLDHETRAYDPVHQVYYIEHIIKGELPQLTIEGQLHSLEDGWLGN